MGELSTPLTAMLIGITEDVVGSFKVLCAAEADLNWRQATPC